MTPMFCPEDVVGIPVDDETTEAVTAPPVSVVNVGTAELVSVLTGWPVRMA